MSGPLPRHWRPRGLRPGRESTRSQMMGNQILVTGGAGYLGSTMVPELLAAGHKVTVLDNFMYDQNSLAHVCNHPGFEVVRGDVRSEITVLPLLKKADI